MEERTVKQRIYDNVPKCGLIKRSDGLPCGNIAMKNGRCRLHGGTLTGAPKGSKNAAKPGSMYSKYKSAEELELIKALRGKSTLEKLEKDIEDAYIRKRRAVLAYDKAVLEGREDELTLRERVVSEGEEGSSIKETFKTVDYLKRISDLDARLESLIKTKEAIISSQKSENTLVIVGGLPDLGPDPQVLETDQSIAHLEHSDNNLSED